MKTCGTPISWIKPQPPDPVDSEIHCCEDFKAARRKGTDNEGYNELILKGHPADWFIGDGLPVMRFCPWCGTSLEVS